MKYVKLSGLKSYLFICAFFLLAAISAEHLNAQQLAYKDSSLIINSEVLGENREIELFFPKERRKAISVFYVLDGEWNHNLVKEILAHGIRWGRYPDAAIVSVKNVNRTRDFTPTEDDVRFPGSGESALFKKFLSEELIPVV